MIVISDTSPINYLVLIEQIDVLGKLYGKVVIPQAVAVELSHLRTPVPVRNWITSPPPWVELRAPKNAGIVTGLGSGESAAILLAKELGADLLLVDDKEARHAATQRGIVITGTLGVLELAAVMGLLDLPTTIQRLRQTPFQIAAPLLDDALRRDAVRKAGP